MPSRLKQLHDNLSQPGRLTFTTKVGGKDYVFEADVMSLTLESDADGYYAGMTVDELLDTGCSLRPLKHTISADVVNGTIKIMHKDKVVMV